MSALTEKIDIIEDIKKDFKSIQPAPPPVSRVIIFYILKDTAKNIQRKIVNNRELIYERPKKIIPINIIKDKDRF